MDKKIDINKAREKIKSYCAYQDRCPHEVIIKLKKLGQNSKSIDIIVDELIHLNFLNEKRYAISFCRGKFRIKKWGRKKIYLELKKREINPKYIHIALAEIDDLEYRQTIAEILLKRNKKEKETSISKRKVKLTKYLVSRGYEYELILDELVNIV